MIFNSLKKNEVMRQAIFVHSLFRSGSTYFYNALKRTKSLHVYHEPMHEVIASLPDQWEAMAGRRDHLKAALRHGFLSGGYFDEYAHLLPGIRKTFDQTVSFDCYFVSANEAAPELGRYVDLLIEGAPRMPVLQCTRTAGRIGWLSANYDAKNIFLLRNPWDQWYSYKVDRYIATTPRLICSQRSVPEVLRAVMDAAGCVALLGTDTQSRLQYGYCNPISPRSDYYLFFGVWLHAYLAGKRDCNLLIDMDELCADEPYRKSTLAELLKLGIGTLDLSDAKLHRALFSPRERDFFELIESQVLEIFRQHDVAPEDLDAARNYLARQREIAFPQSPELPSSCQSLFEDASRGRELLLSYGQHDAEIIADQTRTIDERDTRLAELGRVVAERNTRLAELGCVVAERDTRLAELGRVVAERDTQLAELGRVVAERDTRLAELGRVVAERDTQLAELGRVVAERDTQLAELGRVVAERDTRLAELGRVVAERNTRLAELGCVVAERDTRLAALGHAVTDRNVTIEALRNSTSWKVTAPLRAVGRKIRGEQSTVHDSTLRQTAGESGPTAFFTICAKNFLAHARVLYESVRVHYPNTRFFVVLCDRVDGLFDPAKEPFEFVYLEALNLPNLGDMASRYNITEFNTAVKPFAFTHLIATFGFDSIVYLDPDLFFVDRMVELDRLLNDGAEAVLTPHILQPAERDEIHDGKMLLFGIYNLGFLALRNTPSVKTFLSWWGRKLERECVIRLEEGLFVDQKWADLLPAFVPGTRILHHPGYNIAYWNLPQRQVVKKDGRWFANGEPMRFVHFSGNRLDDRAVFSRHSQQVTIENIGDLRDLLDLYREQVYQQGHAVYRQLPYAYSWNGAAGVNLHTPKELDLASTVPSPTAPNSAQIQEAQVVTQGQVIKSLRRRIGVLRQSMPLARRLSGGWAPFAQRAWRAYRRHGWHYVKAKAVELSGYRAPPPAISAEVQLPVRSDGVAKRLLYLDWAIPKPDQDAASVTARLLLEIVGSLGYKVTFVPCSLKYEEGYYEDLHAANVEVIVYPAIQSVSDWLTAHAQEFDVCIMARGPVVWPYLRLLTQVAPKLRLIFNTVDLHYLRELRQADLANDENARNAALTIRDQEFELIEKCDLSILLSNEEMYTVREINPEARLAILPVVFKDIPGATRPFDERRDILFIGSYPHQPNIDAVLYFAETVFPIIRQRMPDIRFKIIGANPPESIQRLADLPGIEILGFVKDLKTEFSSIRLSVAPLRYGAGIKGKIGTSLCYGVPCVATPIAVEGMGLVNGRNVLVGESPEQFADAVCSAYLDPKVWNALSTEGHRFALDNYSVSVIRQRVANLLGATIDGWRAMHSAFELDGWESYQNHSARLSAEYNRRVLLEQALLPANGSDSFSTSGFCCVCGRGTQFLTSFMYTTGNTPDGRPMPNWREHMQCQHCGLVNRMRAALHALHTLALPQKDDRIYITERVTQTYRWLEDRYPRLWGSEFLGADHEPGSVTDGIQHEDVMNLSFDDNSFDRVLSFDVLEHVPDPDRAFREIFRVLDEQGIFLFSVPFSANSRSDIIRATLRNDGTVEHHLPAEYHGNPVDPDGGALCYRHFGWQMLDQLRHIGFTKVTALAFWSDAQGYLGREQYLFFAAKPAVGNLG